MSSFHKRRSNSRESGDGGNDSNSQKKRGKSDLKRTSSNGGGLPLPPTRSPSKEKEDGQTKTDTASDYFSAFAASDPAESTLLNVLEEGTEVEGAEGEGDQERKSTNLDGSAASFSSPSHRNRKSPNKHGSHRRSASKLQQFVKQISSRKGLSASGMDTSSALNYTYGSQEELESNNNMDSSSNNRLRSSSFGTVQPKSENRLYDTISSWEEDSGVGVDLTSPPRSQRSNGSRRQASSRRLSVNSSANSRRSSISAHAPDSEFLSNLAKNLEETQRFDFEVPAKESRYSEKKKKTPSRGRGHRRLKTTADTLYDHAEQIENLFSPDSQDALDALPSEYFHQNDSGNPDENGQESPAYSDISDDEGGNRRDLEGGIDVMRPLLGRRARRQEMGLLRKMYASLLGLIDVLGPRDIWLGIQDFLLRTVLLLIVPLLSLSAMFFYVFNNPFHHFLPSGATLSWWLIFSVRLSITFQLARASQYLLEILTTRTKIIVRVMGPFAALVAMQSLGWPFLIASWGSWTMVLMHGNYPMNKNWIWFLHIGMFSQDSNPDHGVLENETYLRLLLSMIFVGVATAAKRTVVALYLSRRMLQYYRFQLRDLLADMRMVMEVAELAVETESNEFAKLMQDRQEHNSIRSLDGAPQQSAIASSMAFTSSKAVKMKSDRVPALSKNAATLEMLDSQASSGSSSSSSDDDSDDNDDEDDLVLSEDDDEVTKLSSYNGTPMSTQSWKSKAPSVRNEKTTKSTLTSMDGTEMSGPVQWNELKNAARLKKRTSSPVSRPAEIHDKPHSKKSGKLTKLVPRLERWEEPETKGAKKDLPSLHDILQFRKAMQFMETPYPFSGAFGKARNRKECIKSSVRVYKRLLKFTPGDSVLPYDVIGALAIDDDGDLDEKRAQSLLHVFLPDKDNTLRQLSFVQSIDYIYKDLRFLRASILNSSKIDSVLEDAFDIIFNGILVIIVMTILGLNPWPLLVSFSTLMVSFAFSFGPSCAKYIEGILMIAVRRPYNIGDRITIISGESIMHPTSCETWLVEDISLSTTTLRYAATNEISTVNNAAIADSRIVNGARSDKAIVTILIKFDFQATQEKISNFRIRVENYLIDRPDIWAGLVHFRNNAVSNDASSAEYMLRAQHQRPWQDSPPVMVHRGELEQFMTDVAVDLGIAWRSSHMRFRVMEVPPIKTIAVGDSPSDDENGTNDETEAIKEEPFLKFMKQAVS